MSLPFSQFSSSNGSRRGVTIALVVLSFAFGVFVGDVWGLRRHLFSSGAVDIVKVLGLYSKTRPDSVSFDQFWTVWDTVKAKYVNQPVDEAAMFYGALQGMVAGLDDPYSAYFPPQKAEEFSKDLSGAFEGIGAEIGLRENQLMIIAPMRGSPAERAGLRAGDKVFAIEKIETAGLSLEEAVSKIRGRRGTAVTLTISRDGLDDARDVRIIRDTITVPTVTEEMKEDGIAYVRVSYFNEETVREFDRAVSSLLTLSPKGFILDMRSNPGGFLESAVDVASEWIPDGPVVLEQFQGDERREVASRGGHRLADMPTVVLVDAGTASGSEIVAGALQDYAKATIVGQKTYGKGSVQDYEPLPDGSALKLTVAKWLTPKGRHIDKEGILPDILIQESKEEGAKSDDGAPLGEGKDEAMEKAIEILKKK